MSDLVVNGWRIFLHPLFVEQFEAMVAAVEAARVAHPEDYRSRRAAKLLAATLKMAFEEIPAEPGHPRFRLGGTLGPDHQHWFRGKYVGQYRLFFRFSDRQKVIVLAWVNDEDSKRAYGSRTDAYLVFRKMLASGHPPDDFETLLAQSRPAERREP